MSNDIIPSAADKFVAGVAKTTGWTRDFSGDLLGAAGGGASAFGVLMWMTGNTMALVNPFLWISAAGGAVVTAWIWRRNRRDNL